MSRFGRKVRVGARRRKDWAPRRSVAGFVVLLRAVMWLRMSQHDADHGVVLDRSGGGHHGWLGGVRRAVIADLTDQRGRALILPGIAGNYASSPDAAELDVTGDLRMRVDLRFDSLSTTGIILAKRQSAVVADTSYVMYVTGDRLHAVIGDGTTNRDFAADEDLSVHFAAGERVQVEARVDLDNGASQHEVEFYWRPGEGDAWTQIGGAITGAGAIASIRNSASPLEVGSQYLGTNNPIAAQVYAAEVYDGLTGDEPAFRVDFSARSQGARAFTSPSGHAVAVNQSGSSAAEPLFLEAGPYLYLPGAASNYAWRPDTALLSITGDLSLRAKIAPTTWAPASEKAVIGKFDAGAGYSYLLTIATSGALHLYWSEDGAVILDELSTAAVPFDDLEAGHVRADIDVDNGASGYTVRFYTREEGSDWTQLGADVVGGSTTSVHNGSARLEIGSYGFGSQLPFDGKVFCAEVWDGASKVFDVNFEDANAYDATTETIEAVTGQTVTLSRSAAGRKAAVPLNALFLFGADDYIEVDDHPDLDFADGEEYAVAASFRAFGVPSAKALVSKAAGFGITNSGYSLAVNATQVFGSVSDGAARLQPSATAAASGTRQSGALRFASGTDEAYALRDGANSLGSFTESLGSQENAENLRIGRLAGAGTSNLDGEVFGVALFREPLTAEEHVTLDAELVAA